MSAEDNNYNKEFHSRPALLAVVDFEFGQEPITFLELWGDGKGLEYYTTWLNIEKMLVVERDPNKARDFICNKWKGLTEDYGNIFNFSPCDLADYFIKNFTRGDKKERFDVINMDFCTYFYDNGKPTCTASAVDLAFRTGTIKDGGLMFFTFQVQGLGANLSKQAIRDREEIKGYIDTIADMNGYEAEEVWAYEYNSGKSIMFNYGIKVTELD